MDIISKGIVSGLVLALMIGPVFFTIIQTSIERGFSNGVFVAIGVSISDAMYILISYFGLTQFLSKPEVRLYMAYGGGAVLLAFGIYYLFVKSRKLGKVDYGSLPAKSWTHANRFFLLAWCSQRSDDGVRLSNQNTSTHLFCGDCLHGFYYRCDQGKARR
jgi:threonine/homoserine/homoserine lactone efflux protein